MSHSDESHKRPNPFLQSGPLKKNRSFPPKAIDFGDDNDASSSKSTEKYLGSKTGISLPQPAKKREVKVDIAKHIYGNYSNYYDNRRNKAHLSDPRLDLLDATLFKGKRVLDIGCNSGNLTIAIAKWHLPQYIQGVDIDESLVAKAEALLRTTYSLQKPDGSEEYSSLDIGLRFHYFPRSMTIMHGSVPIEPSPCDTDKFPHNIEFQACDWMDTETEASQYDTVLALSITKWIHIHRGDEGLKEFFFRIFNSLKPGGVFILEPQDFGTYERRAKHSEATQEVFDHIKFLPEHYKDFLLTEVGFREAKDLGIPHNENKGFSRPLTLYTK